MRGPTSLALGCLLLLAFSCGSDHGTDPRPGLEAFLADFAEAYASMDSTRYGAFLDESYGFEQLPEFVRPGEDPWWDRAEELRIAGAMFGGRPNGEGQSVEQVALDIRLLGVETDPTAYAGRQPGEMWYKVTTYIDLRVTADDPEDPSGSMSFVVNSKQIFVVRRDPASEERFSIARQIDQPALNKNGTSPAGTEATNWGVVKLLWR